MKTGLLILIFFTSLVAFGQNPSHKQAPINVAKIESIELMKLNKENPHKYQSKMLYPNQYADFVSKWMSARYLGPEKFKLIEYYVFVTFKDGEKRQYTVSGSNAVGCKIQESESAAYEIKEKAFFDNLWMSIR
jgi:hypothetical protein